ncbi:hypothetical protein DFR70_113139 [Nocardia tenerifensis]|uniref:Uncharacterized protein n=1 Tax=Nocardia tenerifensis TaxID=228006 RepID=A0A318K686_9NOCA|nr:hypothetical protein DFR70_113139 [Nocardia tenerifensis]
MTTPTTTQANDDPRITSDPVLAQEVPVSDGPPVTEPHLAGKRRTGFPVWRSRLIRVASVAAAVGLWQLLTANDVRAGLRFDTLPTVTEIIAEFGEHLGSHQYYLDIGQSLIRIVTGFGLAAVVGVLAGIGLGRSRLLADVFGPLTELAHPSPDHRPSSNRSAMPAAPFRRSRWCRWPS